ncbi:MAG: M1 family aminopeptidase [Acidobacteriota bacterium]
MKYFFVRAVAVPLAAVALTVFSAASQSSNPPASPRSAPSTNALQPRQTPEAPGQVIFSRSTGNNGQTSAQAGAAAGSQTAAPTANDAERAAVAFTAYEMDVHLRPAEHYIAVRALLTVRNSGQSPLPLIPLQISSSLNWERIRVENKDVHFPVATLNSDEDHTGQLHEAAVPLAQPLAPGASMQLDVTYSGAIEQTAKRLIAIGTPEDVALHSDWDRIGLDFTGLRGFGNVVWYPVSSVPVILGDGARVFDEMGEHKLHMTGVHFQLRLSVEFSIGNAPTVAVINGYPEPLSITNAGVDVEGVATANVAGATLGFETPSLFIANREPHKATNATLWTLPTNAAAVPAWSTAISDVTPLLQDWLGERPRSQLTILDLPGAGDAPFETGVLLAIPVQPAPAEQLDSVLAHALTHAWMPSPRAWISEGAAQFMRTLWIEKQSGRKKALESLEAFRSALALAEPSSPGQSSGQPLNEAYSPVYYRVKAAYVLWMLRDIVGDSTLASAFRAYNPAEDVGSPSGRSYFEKLLEQTGNRDLSWFFSDWIDADKGLPDLSIAGVYPSVASPGSWLVAVNIANNGYAAAEVPVSVRSPDGSVTQRVLVPARARIVRRILVLNKPTEVQVNDGVVPEIQASIHITNLTPTAGGSSSSSSPNPQKQ